MLTNMPDLIVEVRPGMIDLSIEMVQAIETEIGKAMVGLGFSQTGSSKSDEVVSMRYRQFGQCGEGGESAQF